MMYCLIFVRPLCLLCVPSYIWILYALVCCWFHRVSRLRTNKRSLGDRVETGEERGRIEKRGFLMDLCILAIPGCAQSASTCTLIVSRALRRVTMEWKERLAARVPLVCEGLVPFSLSGSCSSTACSFFSSRDHEDFTGSLLRRLNSKGGLGENLSFSG
jgi:hypothetical protein